MRAHSILWIPLTLACLARPAAAGVPDPAQSSVETVIVGSSSGAMIGDGFRVTVRDVNAVPVGGATVTLGMPSSVHPYTSQVAPAGVTCATHKIFDATAVSGVVVFRPRVGGYANAPAVLVVANSVLLASVLVRSTDIDADGATAVNDFNLFRINFLTNASAQETDFDESGVTDVGDFNVFRRIFLFDDPGTPCP